MREKSIQIVNNRGKSQIITENKTLMEFAADYAKEKELKNDVFDQINHVRLFKNIILLVEIVGARGLVTTECYDKIEVKSIIEWKIEFPPIAKPNTKATQTWNKFKEWLKMKELHTIYNFKSKAESRMKVPKYK